mmetsp:Transcript_24555/g.46359  ORF Transcript_24555/g.46359 Transcript_24555/m.46359 type:complete len:91 (+) Transcript_24555:826-1098(+)
MPGVCAGIVTDRRQSDAVHRECFFRSGVSDRFNGAQVCQRHWSDAGAISFWLAVVGFTAASSLDIDQQQPAGGCSKNRSACRIFDDALDH